MRDVELEKRRQWLCKLAAMLYADYTAGRPIHPTTTLEMVHAWNMMNARLEPYLDVATVPQEPTPPLPESIRASGPELAEADRQTERVTHRHAHQAKPSVWGDGFTPYDWEDK